LLDTDVEWEPVEGGSYRRRSHQTGDIYQEASGVELLFGSHAVLRAYCEVYASDEEKFVQDFVAAFVKVMDLDRFDLRQ